MYAGDYHILRIYAEDNIYKTMNIQDYQSKADLFKILSHPIRLQILNALRKQSCCVCHLQTITHRPQAYISQQLRVLREAGLAMDEKDGQNVYYRLCDETVDVLLRELFGQAASPSTQPDCTCPKCVVDHS